MRPFIIVANCGRHRSGTAKTAPKGDRTAVPRNVGFFVGFGRSWNTFGTVPKTTWFLFHRGRNMKKHNNLPHMPFVPQTPHYGERLLVSPPWVGLGLVGTGPTLGGRCSRV
jgi:hypothetical protein